MAVGFIPYASLHCQHLAQGAAHGKSTGKDPGVAKETTRRDTRITSAEKPVTSQIPSGRWGPGAPFQTSNLERSHTQEDLGELP